MCGIFGYQGIENHENLFFDLLKHRGPDAHACIKKSNWTLGHLRLSIIDIDSLSNQPFEKDGAVLVFNGEIYNYIELKEKYFPGEIFRTQSDTEVLISLLNKFGLSILDDLNGMFAFAYLDRCGQLYLVRDRFGVKPLYYCRINELLYFSSEMKPLLALLNDCELDESIVEAFMIDTATDFDDRSGYKNIKSLMSGHYILVNKEVEQNQKKWYFGLDKKRSYGGKKQLVEECEEILLDAIRIRCRSDVPIAITLSGGIDSTLIYTLIKERLGLKIQPFVFQHNDKKTDESTLAIDLAKGYSDTPIIVSQSTPPLQDLKRALWHLEFPMWNPSAVAYFSMYREIAAMGFKVVLEGHGSDEQMGGYPYMVDAAAVEALQNKSFLDYISYLKVSLQTNHSGLEQSIAGLSLLRYVLLQFKRAYFGKPVDANGLINHSFDYKILPIVLRTFDRLSMAHSLESRMPFMDYRFVEFARKLPVHAKVSEIGNKALLREILKKYGKEAIYGNKKKMGFASDLPAIFRDKDFSNYIQGLVQKFNLDKYDKQRKRASAALQEEISWGNSADVWKVAALSHFSYENPFSVDVRK
jgi:asparagine synthase (glutamine-hydrolysing)